MEIHNEHRRLRAAAAVRAYRDATNTPDSEPQATVIVDLIADLLHLADLTLDDELGPFDGITASKRSWYHYDEERESP